VAVLLTRGRAFAWARLYYLPGLRRLIECAYEWVARNRYRLVGRAECAHPGCALHFRRRRNTSSSNPTAFGTEAGPE
jgi:predicted DCC family thiol-disulfide oxidoreductase YuxK